MNAAPTPSFGSPACLLTWARSVTPDSALQRRLHQGEPQAFYVWWRNEQIVAAEGDMLVFFPSPMGFVYEQVIRREDMGAQPDYSASFRWRLGTNTQPAP